ncbi:MAG: DinB family protein [Spirochaetales bacterium]|nr:DinB family protein [Spirochaetales bacterium]
MNQKEISQNIIKEVTDFFDRFKNIDDDTASVNINADKWSLKQIISHLIDSASNNHQRIVRLQIEKRIEFPDYNRDEWLGVGDYNSRKYSDLLSLLKYYNILLANIIENIENVSLDNTWNMKWSESQENISLGELIEHYLSHLVEHIHHFENRLKELRESEADGISGELHAAVDKLITGCEALNMESAFGIFSDSSEFLMMGTDGSLCDYQTYIRNNMEYLKDCRSFRLNTFKREIRILDEKTAIYSWAYGAEATLKTGETDIVENAGASFLFRKTMDEWKVVYYHESSVPWKRRKNK